MKLQRYLVTLSLVSYTMIAAAAPDIDSGKAKVASVCAACHGLDGASVTDSIPNLAAQRANYLSNQLKAFKNGARKHDIMSAIASQLSDAEIGNVAGYFASLAGAASGAKSAPMESLTKTMVSFPQELQKNLTTYIVTNFPEQKRVKHNLANAVALNAARADKPLPDGSVLVVATYSAKLDAEQKPVLGKDGKFVADQPISYTAMAREAGWGASIPEMLRNDDWNYALFTGDGKPRANANYAECFGCHKHLDKESYAFTWAQLKAFPRP